MSPLECMKDIADHLKEKLKIENCYAGFLPKIDKVKDAAKRCPSIAVRGIEIVDLPVMRETTMKIAIYVVTYDDDMMYGAEGLYSLLERVRYEILTEEPIKNKWGLKPGETVIVTIPDEQIYPYWIGAVECVMRMPHMRNYLQINRMTR